MIYRGRMRLLPALAVALVLTGLPVAAATLPAPSAPAAPTRANLPPLDPTAANTRLDHEIYGYLPYWELDGGTDPYIRYEMLTTLAFFGVPIRGDGHLNTSHAGYAAYVSDRAATIIEHAHAAGVRTDLTITSFGYDVNARFFGDTSLQTTAINDIVALVALRGADGVNLDVELMSGNDFDAYGAFVGALRSRLLVQNPAARLTVATNANTSGARMAKVAIINGADRAFIMGYAYRSAGSDPVGSNGPLERADGGLSIRGTLDYYTTAGVPFDHLVLGLPYYGYSWPTRTASLNSARQPFATYGGGSVFLPRYLPAAARGSTLQFDPIEATGWFARWDYEQMTWVQAYYEDARSLLAKYRYAAERGLAGAGMWALGYDRGTPGFWEAIDVAYGIDGAPRLLGVAVQPNPLTSLDTSVAVTWENGIETATEIRLANDGHTWSDWMPLAATVPWRLADGPDGARLVSAQLRDSSGHLSWVMRAPADFHVMPRIHLVRVVNGAPDTLDATVQVQWDDGAVPASSVRLSNDGATWSDWLPIAASIPWTLADGNDGPRSVWVQLQDPAGLLSEVRRVTTTLDRAPQLDTFAVAQQPATTAAVTVQLGWTDFGDPSTQVRLSNDGRTWGDWQTAASSLDWTLASGLDGPRSVWVQLRDAADHRSTIRSADTQLQAAPVISSITVSPEPPDTRDVTLDIVADPLHDPATSVRLSNDGTTWSAWLPMAPTIAWSLADGPPGPRTISAQLRDDVGNEGPVATKAVELVPAPGPSTAFGPPGQVAGGQVGRTGRISVTLSWASDPAAPPAAWFELKGRVDGGAWRQIGTVPLTSTTRSLSLLQGHRYRYQVRSFDAAGTPGRWTLQTVRVALYGDSSSAITYTGSWALRTLSTSLGGAVHSTTTPGDIAVATITGRAVSWVSVVGPGRGSAEVSVDGVVETTVDLAATTSSARRLVFSWTWPSIGRHVIQIRVLPPTTPASTTGRVDIDGFTVVR